MATVPLQQTPTEQIDTGGTPLFSATNIQPVKDTGVAQDINRLSKEQKQFAIIAADLQDQHDDVKSNEAYRGYQEEADVKVNEYLNLQRGDAIATVDYDEKTNKPITRYDQLVNDLTEISNKYLGTLDNKAQKKLFNDKYSASKRISVNSASKHSLKQTRLKLTEEAESNVNMAKKRAINNFESWQEEDGDYKISIIAGHLELKRLAELNGRNTDINKGPLSSKYLEDVQAYNKEVMEGVIDRLEKLPGGHALVREYVKAHKPEETKNIVTKLEISIAEKHEDYNVEQCVNGVLTANGNQNTGSFLDQTPKLMCLKSNHYVNDGTGASVHDGNHSTEINIAGQTQENNIDTLEKIRNESKFYRLDSNATLINEHQPTHLFAVQHLGVKKADSLYTKAKSSLEIDTARYKEDATYAKQINEKIIDNYNNLINEEANKKYKGDYVNAIANDLEIIKKGINYDGDFTSDVDFITGLRPLDVLKAEIKETITDPKQQKYALQDLEIKYNKISSERTKVYNEGLNAAKEIAFAEEGGWKNLEANGIKIENFSESDQEILKKGQPEESDLDTLIELEKNPVEVATNLPAYSQLLSQSDYLGLKNYANSLRSESSTGSATADSTMFDDTLITYGFDTIFTKKKGKGLKYNTGETDLDKKKDYIQLKAEWKERINQFITDNNGAKPTNAEKQKMLNEILNDKVYVKTPLHKKNILIPAEALDDDQFKDAFVFVGGKKVYTKRIPDEVRQYFIKGYVGAGMSYTEEMIANEWVLHGKGKSKKEIIKFKEENNL
jgi:hypothetical protein